MNEDEGTRHTTENLIAQLVRVDGDGAEVRLLSSPLKGATRRVQLRKAYVLGRKSFPELVASGLREGGVVELQNARAEADGALSALRAEVWRPNPAAEHPVVRVGALASIRQPDDKALPASVLVIRRDAATAAATLPFALAAGLHVLSAPVAAGRPGFLIRAHDPDWGVTAAACLPRADLDGADAARGVLDAFQHAAGDALAALAAAFEHARHHGGQSEVVPLSLLPVAPERASRFAAHAVNYKFSSPEGSPRFVECHLAEAPDRKGVWRAHHLTPRSTAPVMVGVDYPPGFSEDAR